MDGVVLPLPADRVVSGVGSAITCLLLKDS